MTTLSCPLSLTPVTPETIATPSVITRVSQRFAGGAGKCPACENVVWGREVLCNRKPVFLGRCGSCGRTVRPLPAELNSVYKANMAITETVLTWYWGGPPRLWRPGWTEGWPEWLCNQLEDISGYAPDWTNVIRAITGRVKDFVVIAESHSLSVCTCKRKLTRSQGDPCWIFLSEVFPGYADGLRLVLKDGRMITIVWTPQTSSTNPREYTEKRVTGTLRGVFFRVLPTLSHFVPRFQDLYSRIKGEISGDSRPECLFAPVPFNVTADVCSEGSWGSISLEEKEESLIKAWNLPAPVKTEAQ